MWIRPAVPEWSWDYGRLECVDGSVMFECGIALVRWRNGSELETRGTIGGAFGSGDHLLDRRKN